MERIASGVTARLRAALEASADGRVIWLSSGGMLTTRLDLEDPRALQALSQRRRVRDLRAGVDRKLRHLPRGHRLLPQARARAVPRRGLQLRRGLAAEEPERQVLAHGLALLALEVSVGVLPGVVHQGLGVARHVDAGYEQAVEVANERGVKIPML